jgi:hypothetical protein
MDDKYFGTEIFAYSQEGMAFINIYCKWVHIWGLCSSGITMHPWIIRCLCCEATQCPHLQELIGKHKQENVPHKTVYHLQFTQKQGTSVTFVSFRSPYLFYLLIVGVKVDHTQIHTRVGRTPLDEGSARHRDLYLTTQTLTIDKHPFPRWDLNPRSHQALGHRPTP